MPLAEVAGLRVSDVHLDHAIPHIMVEWHEDRRIKNAVSRRDVPLVGSALGAAKAAVKAAGGAAMLFTGGSVGHPRLPLPSVSTSGQSSPIPRSLRTPSATS